MSTNLKQMFVLIILISLTALYWSFAWPTTAGPALGTGTPAFKVNTASQKEYYFALMTASLPARAAHYNTTT
ncbi:MAG: hypothetical protein LH618_09390, partial [Saprospiraceae bacterium]|nr:hypothetical protein [Saprospiraceae bacterium]